MVHAELIADLAKNERRALALPVDTRWGTLERCFSSILGAEPFLHTLVSKCEFMNVPGRDARLKRRAIHDLVRDVSFVPNLERGQKLLEVLTMFSRRVERNQTPASDVYEMFTSLSDRAKDVGLSKAEIKVFSDIVSAKFDFLYDDAHIVAYLLDPRFVGKSMDIATRVQVENLIAKWHGPKMVEEVSAELLSYFALIEQLCESESRMLKLVIDRKVSPLTFWCGLTSFPLLSPVARAAFSSACSTAAAERNFSAQDYVHWTLRNRLRSERVEKLLHVYFNGKNDRDEEAEFFDEIEQLLEPNDDKQEPERLRVLLVLVVSNPR